MVRIDKRVLEKTILDASSLSALYLSASMRVITPAGVPLKTTEMPITMESERKMNRIPKTIMGMKIRRIKENHSVKGVNIFFVFICPRTHPTTIIESGVEMFPRLKTIRETRLGGLKPVSVIIIPRYVAIMQG